MTLDAQHFFSHRFRNRIESWIGSVGRFLESVLLTPFVYIKGRHIAGSRVENTFEDILIVGLLGVGTWLVVMLVNDLTDGNTDRHNPHKVFHRWLLAGLSRQTWWVVYLVSLVLFVMIPWIVFDFFTFSIMLGIVFLSFLYSRGPRLKEKAPFDSLIGGCGHVLPYLLGQWHGDHSLQWSWTLWFGIRFFAVHALTTIVDYEADYRAGVKSFAVRFKPERASIIIGAIFFIDVYRFGFGNVECEWPRLVCFLGAFTLLALIGLVSHDLSRLLQTSETSQLIEKRFRQIHLLAIGTCFLFVGTFAFGMVCF